MSDARYVPSCCVIVINVVHKGIKPDGTECHKLAIFLVNANVDTSTWGCVFSHNSVPPFKTKIEN